MDDHPLENLIDGMVRAGDGGMIVWEPDHKGFQPRRHRGAVAGGEGIESGLEFFEVVNAREQMLADLEDVAERRFFDVEKITVDRIADERADLRGALARV